MLSTLQWLTYGGTKEFTKAKQKLKLNENFTK